MASQHTPGPWTAKENAGEIRIAARDRSIGRVTVRPDSLGQCRADARLMVAAPDLLEALRYIADEESGWRFRSDPLEHARSVIDEMRDMARAAIAKAKGGE